MYNPIKTKPYVFLSLLSKESHRKSGSVTAETNKETHYSLNSSKDLQAHFNSKGLAKHYRTKTSLLSMEVIK